MYGPIFLVQNPFGNALIQMVIRFESFPNKLTSNRLCMHPVNTRSHFIKRIEAVPGIFPVFFLIAVVSRSSLSIVYLSELSFGLRPQVVLRLLPFSHEYLPFQVSRKAVHTRYFE